MTLVYLHSNVDRRSGNYQYELVEMSPLERQPIQFSTFPLPQFTVPLRPRLQCSADSVDAESVDDHRAS